MKRIFTVPNILSFVRILLIPIFIVFYFMGNKDAVYYVISVVILALSGLTDIVDGIIARKCNMVSDLGKVLDPAADKLTQASVAVCLAIDIPMITPMLIILVLKESAMAIGALLLLKSGEKPIDAKWFGKMSTVILYSVMILIIIDKFCNFMPDGLVLALVIIATVSILFSVINYYLLFRNVRKKNTSGKEAN